MAYIWRPPEELKSQLQSLAKKMGIPLSNLLILICRDYLSRKEKKWMKIMMKKLF